MKHFSIQLLILFLLSNLVFADEIPSVYTKEDHNIYINAGSEVEIQLTFQGKDYELKLSPDRQRAIFVRHVKECPFTSDTGWFPSDFDEIWSMNIDGSNKRCIIKNNYPKTKDMNNYIGCFDTLRFSPDGRRIYFLCQNCATNALLYTADVDGGNIRKICYAHGFEVIGGNPEDEYYGYLVAYVKKAQKDLVAYRWTSVLMNPDGNEIKEIDDLDEFWRKHEKI